MTASALPRRRGRNAGTPRASVWQQPRGLTLFEVVVSLAIFVGSMAAIGQLIHSGMRGAVEARLQSQGVIYCESLLAEAVAGIIPLQQVQNASFPGDAAWKWSMGIAPGPHQYLYVVELTVSHPASNVAGEMSVSLRRLVRDPQLALDALQKQLEQQAASGTSSSSSSSGSSTGSSSSSGGSR